ncbi:hypothetical protein M8J76_016596 [Diaphorina citri]|nr:hypothetical protein M8J76_016596 [Diaphorina citri]
MVEGNFDDVSLSNSITSAFGVWDKIVSDHRGMPGAGLLRFDVPGLALQILLLVAVVAQRPSGLNKRHDVYIAGFFPYTRDVVEGKIGRGVMPAVKLAVDHINESPTVLRNYRLHMWWNDTELMFIRALQGPSGICQTRVLNSIQIGQKSPIKVVKF